MFGFRLITDREMRIWQQQIQDMHREIAIMREQIDHERRRAEGAINLLLAKTTGAVITDSSIQDDIAKRQRDTYNIFGDDYEPDENEKRLLEDIQK